LTCCLDGTYVHLDLYRRKNFFDFWPRSNLTPPFHARKKSASTWYRKRSSEIHRWIDLGEWIHGETGGYLRI
jgi:hypothetical protein